MQVGVRNRRKLRTADGRLSVVESLEPVSHLRIGKRIGINICADGHRLYIGFDAELPFFIRVYGFAVCEDKWHGHLQIRDVLKLFLDVHHRHAFTAGNVERSVRLQFAVGVGSRYIRQTVVPVIEMRFNLLVPKQFLGRYDIDAVTA